MPSRAQIQKLLDLEPNDPFMLYAMATDYAKEGEHESAIEFYQKTIEVDAEYCYAYYHQARSYEALGRLEEAKSTLDRGLEVSERVGDSQAINETRQYRTMLA